jgi:hypothetical protein
VTPPIVARLLVIAVAPPRDYDSVAGDLHEEYVQRATTGGRVAADHWYWSQAIRSIPSLLWYSRVRHSFIPTIAMIVLFLVLLASMVIAASLVTGELFDYANTSLGGSVLAWSCVTVFGSWIVAAMFGAILSAIFRGNSHRLMLATAVVFVLAFVIMPNLGLGPFAPLGLWQYMVLFGEVLAVGIGATTYQFVRKR